MGFASRRASVIVALVGIPKNHRRQSMWYLVLATDYDGTVATHGTILPETVKSLERCLDSGRKLVMVTGRELPDLQRVCPHLSLFEWVVAENGGLLYRPATREERPLAKAPREDFVLRLRERGVAPLSVGKVIVATWEPHENTVLQTIRDLGLEMQVIFNKGAVMILPTGINKATGLAAALAEMGISPHNVVGVGDAENDNALLGACEVGVAVANATPQLKDRADYVTTADHGAGVAELIDRLRADDLSSLDQQLSRHSILLGTRADGSEVRLPPYKLNLLVAGSSGGGKSTTATALLERLVEQHYQVCVIDPEGDYQEFEGTVVCGTAHQPPAADAVLQLLAPPKQHLVVNLIGLPIQDRPGFFLSLLTRLQDMRTQTARPHWLVIDEAHHVLPSTWTPATVSLPRHLKQAMFITLTPDLLSPAVLQSIDRVIAVGDHPDETLRKFAEAVEVKPPKRSQKSLEHGQLALWTPGSTDPPEIIKLTPGTGVRRRHSRKYAEGALEPDRSFYFRGPEGKLNLRAQNLITFLQLAEGIDDETWLFHLRAGDYSKWLRETIKDPDLADEAAMVERQHAMSPLDSRGRIKASIENRYTLPASPATPVSSKMSSPEERGKAEQPTAN